MRIKFLIRTATSMALVGLLCSCGPNTEEYARFAQAGVEYAQALDELLVVVGEISIDANSEALLSNERDLKAPEPKTFAAKGFTEASLSKTRKSDSSTQVSSLSPTSGVAIKNSLALPSPQAVCRNVSSQAEDSTGVTVPTQPVPEDKVVSNLLYSSYENYARCDKERLIVLALLREQSALLGSYFAKLNELATSDSPDQAATAAEKIGDGLKTITDNLGPQAVQAKLISDGTLSQVFSTLGKLIVSSEIRGALRSELDQRKDTIEKALALQTLLLDELAKQLQDDVAFTQQLREERQVIAPYIQASPIANSEEWINNRRGILTMKTSVAQLSSARAVSEDMQSAFSSLTSNKLTVARATAVLFDIDSLLAIIKDLKNK